MKAKPIKEVLSNYLKGTNFKKINELTNICTAWTNIVGKTIDKNTKIQSIKKGKITVRVANSTWRNELIFQKEGLLNRLKQEEPEINIKEIEFR